MVSNTRVIATTCRTVTAAVALWLAGRAAAGDGFAFEQHGGMFTWTAASSDGRFASRGHISLEAIPEGTVVTLATDHYDQEVLRSEGVGTNPVEVHERIVRDQIKFLDWLEHLSQRVALAGETEHSGLTIG